MTKIFWPEYKRPPALAELEERKYKRCRKHRASYLAHKNRCPLCKFTDEAKGWRK